MVWKCNALQSPKYMTYKVTSLLTFSSLDWLSSFPVNFEKVLKTPFLQNTCLLDYKVADSRDWKLTWDSLIYDGPYHIHWFALPSNGLVSIWYWPSSWKIEIIHTIFHILLAILSKEVLVLYSFRLKNSQKSTLVMFGIGTCHIIYISY